MLGELPAGLPDVAPRFFYEAGGKYNVWAQAAARLGRWATR